MKNSGLSEPGGCQSVSGPHPGVALGSEAPSRGCWCPAILSVRNAAKDGWRRVWTVVQSQPVTPGQARQGELPLGVGLRVGEAVAPPRERPWR